MEVSQILSTAELCKLDNGIHLYDVEINWWLFLDKDLTGF